MKFESIIASSVQQVPSNLAFNINDLPCTYNGQIDISRFKDNAQLIARQTFGLDFIFVNGANGKEVRCVEIGGRYSGIDGFLKSMAHLKDRHDSLTKIIARAHSFDFTLKAVSAFYSMYLQQNFLQFLFNNMLLNFPQHFFISRVAFFHKLYRNRYADLEYTRSTIFWNKKAQKVVIPYEYRIPYIKQICEINEGSDYLIKPKVGMQGRGIIKAHSFYAEKYVGIPWYIVEPMLYALPVELAFDKPKNRASMRIYANISFYERRDQVLIVPDFALAYQRVAALPGEVVVNFSKGASAYPASKSEFALAWQAFQEVVKNISRKILQKENTVFVK